MIDLGALKITIETGADKAKQELNDVGETAEKQESKFSKFGNALKTGLIAGGAAAAAKKITEGIMDIATNAADAAGDLDDMAQRTGTSAEEFQKLAYAAKLSGMETSTLESAMIKQQKAFADASTGNEAMAESYSKLGINISEVGSSSEAFDMVIARLADMEDETQRNALASEIFGKSYAELTPLLNNGSEGINKLKQEAVDLGGVMSNEAVEAGAKFGDSLDAVKTATSGAFMEIGVQFLPILQKLLEWVLAHMPEIKKVIETVFKAVEIVVGIVGKAFDAILPILTTLYEWIEPYFPVIQSIVETTFGAIGSAVEIVTDIFWGVVDAIKSAIEWLQSWNDTEAEDKDVGGSGNNKPYRSSHASGLDYVPFNNFVANLHEGEAVLTAQQAEVWRNGSTSNVNIVVNATVREEADIQKISRQIERDIRTKQRGTVLA